MVRSLDFSSQDEIKIMGHSIECRICAEDPQTMLPAPGKVSSFEYTFPQGVRFDHCIFDGLDVKPDFDPMIGKLIVRGNSRDVAIRKMQCAIKSLHIDGIKTNVKLHEIIIEEPNFVAGNYTTNYIAEVSPGDKVAELISEDDYVKKAISLEYMGMRNRL